MGTIRTIILSLFFAFTTIIAVQAQEAVIKGYAPGAEGLKAKLITYADQVSFREKQIASSIIDTSGHFTLRVPIKKTTFVFLSIEKFRAEFYLESEKSYNVSIERQAYELPEEELNPFKSYTLNLQFPENDTTELNVGIHRFNLVYNYYILDHWEEIYLKKNKKHIDTMNMYIDEATGYINNAYFNTYKKYRFASLQLMNRSKKRMDLAREYLLDQPVLYHHIEYMEFFNQYFDGFLISSRRIPLEDLEATINEQGSLPALMDSVGKDTLLRNERLRELVLLRNLADIYNNPIFNQSKILDILKQFKQSKFEQHRIISGNLLYIFTRLSPGTKAPEFRLRDIKQIDHNLKEYGGKHIVLTFWASWCVPCQADLSLIPRLNQKYGDTIDFVHISIDREFVKLYYYLKDTEYDWDFLYCGNQTKVLEDYNVKTIPTSVFIDPEGKIIKYGIPSPSDGLEYYLDKYFYLNRKEKLPDY